VRRDFRVFVSPPRRTDRHTATCGGTGGTAAGSPTRSTSAHVSARSSYVLAPVSNDITTYARIRLASEARSTASA
jgi:hypothetical protein